MKGRENKARLDGKAYEALYGIGPDGTDGINAAENAFNLGELFIVREEPVKKAFMTSEHIRQTVENILAKPTDKERELFSTMSEEEQRSYAEQHARNYAKRWGIEIRED